MSASLLLLVVIALGAAPLLLRKPALAVMILSFLLTLHANLILSQRFDVDLADPLLFGMMVGLVAVYPLLHGDRANGTGRFLGAVLLWLAGVLNSLLWSTSAGVSLAPVQAFLPNILYALALLLLITDRYRLFAALNGVVAACVLLSLLTIIQVSFGLQEFDFYGLANGSLGHIADGVDALRPTGPVYDPNYYCQILIIGFGLAIGSGAGGQVRELRLQALFAASVIAIAMLLTGSRGGLLAAGASVFFVLYSYKRIHYLLFLLPPLLVTLYLFPAYSDRLVSIAASTGELVSGASITESSVAGRWDEMQAAILLFVEQPLTGIGYGMFESRYQDISSNYDLQLRGQDRSAHSLYLETVAEQGLIGLAALLALIGSSLRALHLARVASASDNAMLPTLKALAAAGVGLFASSVFLHDAYGQHFWLFLALLFASERLMHPAAKPLNQRVTVDA